LLDDNTIPHRARVVNEYLQQETLNAWTDHQSLPTFIK
jgi:hypothetical protein